MITEHLMRPGNGDVRFRGDIPTSATATIRDWVDENASGPGAHIVITPNHVDPAELGDTATLSAAIYTGVITARPSRLSLEFAGLGVWLDTYIDSTITRTSGTASQWLGDLLTNGLSAGTVTATGTSNVTRTFLAHVATRREALDAIAALGDWEYEIMPDFTVDAATAANLFRQAGDDGTVIVTAKGGGYDGALRGVEGGLLDQALTRLGPNIATKAVALAEGQGAAIVKGTATRSVSLKTRSGGTPALVSVLSAPAESNANANTLASNFLNLQGMRRAVNVASSSSMVRRHIRPGDELYAYDLPSGLFVSNNLQVFHGEPVFPITVRLLTLAWPIEAGAGVYIRKNATTAEYLDVTDWVEWETSDAWWTVGDWNPPSYGRTNRTDPEVETRIAGTGAESGIYTDNGASIADATAQAVTLTASSDPRGWLSAGTVVPDVAGWYRVSVFVQFPTSAAGRVFARVQLNGTTFAQNDRTGVSSGVDTLFVTAAVEVNGTTDAILLRLYQDSGGALTPDDVQVVVELLPGH